MKVCVLLLAAVCSGLLLAEPRLVSPNFIVDQYCVASQQQETKLNGASMEVEIDASLPKLKKNGRLHALRHISTLGRITYDALHFEGDNTVKRNVIARYLSAEEKAQGDESPSLGVTPANYKFKYRGLGEFEGRQVHIFRVTPRKKRVGMFKGEVWIDAATYLRVRESGRLVKNPSIFLKKVEFVRKYEIRDGISVPKQIQTIVDTRLVGKAEMTIDYRNVSFVNSGKRASLIATDGR